MKNMSRKNICSFFICFILLGTALPLLAQNTGHQYSLGFYQPSADSGNYHSSMRDYMKQPAFDLPQDSTRKRSWLNRKIFSEHLLEYNKPDYSFYVSFLPDFQLGRSSANGTTWLNTRGAVIGGTLGRNFEFKAEFFENQGKFGRYINDFARDFYVMPGQAEVKSYSNGKAFDYAYSSALLSYTPSKFVNFQLGYDRNFIGDGYRSMLLSDVAGNYPFLKITTGAGRLKYSVIWAQFIDMMSPKFSYDNGFRKKWGVFHYLDWNVTDKFSIGVFESVIWQDADSTGKRGFDVSYLAPFAFARPIEFSVGSADNALLGFNLKYAVTPNSTFYGQFNLDEFKLKEFTSGKGWWGNKYGGQIGFRSNNLFKVPKLNALFEVNAARPFTYAQRTSLLSYSHLNQPLAHTMGANFVEWMNIADYQYKRWYFRGQVQLARYGQDTTGTNFGKNILKSYETRALDYGNKIGQGIKTDLLFLQGTIAFLLNPKNNLRLEVSVAGRQEKNTLETKRELIYQICLRSTFRQLYYDF